MTSSDPEVIRRQIEDTRRELSYDVDALNEKVNPARVVDRRVSAAKGRMTSLNFDTYQVLRIAEMPKVETVLVPSYDFWGGVGEPTICVVTPAVMNAIFAATGKPVRSLPLKNVKLV